MAISSLERGRTVSAFGLNPMPLEMVPNTLDGYSAFTPWRAALDREDRRQTGRRSLHCKILLVDDSVEGGDEQLLIPGECMNVSDAGLYGVVPIGYGVAMGQRYSFRLIIDERGPEPGSVHTVSQPGYIVRTELLIGEDGSGDRVGIAVRLSGHRSGMVPMPVSA